LIYQGVSLYLKVEYSTRTEFPRLFKIGDDNSDGEDGVLQDLGITNPTDPALFVYPLRRGGATRITYKPTCGNFVAKVSYSNPVSVFHLKAEANRYRELPSGVRHAENYGIFKIGRGGCAHALVLSYEGEPVSFGSLSSDDRFVISEFSCFQLLRLMPTDALLHHRASLLCDLDALHEAGLEHRVFAERNVIRKQGHKPVIIDFSYSPWGHECEGEELCPELLEAREMLRGS